MILLKILDRRSTLYEQRSYILSFIFFGMPLGYIFAQLLTIAIESWGKYHFNIYNLLGNIITNIIILIPIIYNYYRHKNRYVNIIRKISLNSNKEYKVKALYDYKNFVKGQLYTVYFDQIENEFYIDEYYYPLKKLINKFELDDIKEDRMKKLKKLKKLWL